MALKLDKTNLVRNLATKHKLVPFLEKEIAKDDFEWAYKYSPKESDDAWHPSGHCTPSLYELYHIAKDPEPQEDRNVMNKTFQVGHFWHQYLQQICFRAELCSWKGIERRGWKGWGPLDIEDWHYPYHWVTGAGDIAPCIVPGHGKYLVDIKTMGDHDFKPMGLPAWCAEKYECQVNVYMDLFGLDKALIVCVQKGTPHAMKEFEFERNQPLIDTIYQKWELVSQCLDEDIEPPKEEVIKLPTRGPK